MLKRMFFLRLFYMLLGVFMLQTAMFGQESFVEQSLVVNIEVPVRVFFNGRFVNNLKIGDFEIYEEGTKQKIEAVYLVHRGLIQRTEGKENYFPETSRNFFLLFDVSEYNVYLRNSLNFFVNEVILPGDMLQVVTPLKTYRLRQNALKLKSKKAIEEELTGILRKDIQGANSEHRSIIGRMKNITANLTALLSEGNNKPMGSQLQSGDGFDDRRRIQEFMVQYQGELTRMETLRRIDQMKLLDFSYFLKGLQGQKYIFLFYEREYMPQIDPKIINQYLDLNQEHYDITHTLTELFGFHNEDLTVDVEKIKRAYADSSISVHFLFFTPPKTNEPGIYFEERSGDVFNVYKEMAHSTGGFIDVSSRPDVLLKKAVETAENYYLLYYTPKEYEPDGSFKNIKVVVKDKKYAVSHRLGYFSY
ncbi:MAG: hypothetical protein JXB26_14525 [Candidatus Aminicenantes bacterium]|nr:hypothetical protein [Candidatus Aminicenantes bacterium]